MTLRSESISAAFPAMESERISGARLAELPGVSSLAELLESRESAELWESTELPDDCDSLDWRDSPATELLEFAALTELLETTFFVELLELRESAEPFDLATEELLPFFELLDFTDELLTGSSFGMLNVNCHKERFPLSDMTTI